MNAAPLAWGVYQQLTGESRVLPFPTVVWFSESMRHNVTMLGPRASYTYALTRKHQLSGIFRLAGNQFVYTDRQVPLYDGDGNIRQDNVQPALTASALNWRWAITSDRYHRGCFALKLAAQSAAGLSLPTVTAEHCV